jgi:hypothetical protein
VCLLRKTIYGLKQSPHEWNKDLDEYLISVGFNPCISDPCVYTHISKNGNVMILAIFVDDIISAYATADEAEYQSFKQLFMEKYKTTDLGDAKWLLKMKITRDRKARTLFLDQELYINKIISTFNMDQSKPTVTPECTNIILSLDDSPVTDEEKLGMVDKPYEAVVGSLLYASISTRPDISHSVNKLSRYLRNPGEKHWLASKTTLRYLHGTTTTGLLFTGYKLNNTNNDVKHIVTSSYCDASYGGDEDNRSSTSGFLVYVGDNLVSWSSRKQDIVTLSSCEAEYVSACETAKEIVWINHLLSELTFKQTSPTLLYCDNQSAIVYSNNKKITSRTKHIDIRYHFLKMLVKNQSIDMKWISTDKQLADVLTKSLGSTLFTKFRDQLVSKVPI